MNIERSDTFGNYLIHGIDEIVPPDPVSWWPSAPGWKFLGALLLLWAGVRTVRMIRRWWRNRYRREALRHLSRLEREKGWREVVAALPYYLKAVALHAYPRVEVASLSGEAWARFLDAHYDGPAFAGAAGKKLLLLAYLPPERREINEAEARRLIDMARLWIATHREAAHV